MPGELVIRADMNKTCIKCGKPGATQKGICLACFGKGIAEKGRRTMAAVKTVFLLGDVHPKVKIDGEGVAHHMLSIRLDRSAYAEADAHALVDMLGERVVVTIAREQDKLPGT